MGSKNTAFLKVHSNLYACHLKYNDMYICEYICIYTHVYIDTHT